MFVVAVGIGAGVGTGVAEGVAVETGVADALGLADGEGFVSDASSVVVLRCPTAKVTSVRAAAATTKMSPPMIESAMRCMAPYV